MPWDRKSNPTAAGVGGGGGGGGGPSIKGRALQRLSTVQADLGRRGDRGFANPILLGPPSSSRLLIHLLSLADNFSTNTHSQLKPNRNSESPLLLVQVLPVKMPTISVLPASSYRDRVSRHWSSCGYEQVPEAMIPRPVVIGDLTDHPMK